MTRAEALAFVIAPMPSGMARKIVRETLLSWPEGDVADWHKMRDAERKREKRAELAIVRSMENEGSGQRPVGAQGESRTTSGSPTNGKPDATPPPGSPSPVPPSSPAPTPTHVTGADEADKFLPDGSRKTRPDTEQQVIDRCISLGLPSTDGQAIWAKWEGNGFTNDRKPMKNWHAVVRSWQLHGYLPSQRGRNGHTIANAHGNAGGLSLSAAAPAKARDPTPSEVAAWLTTHPEWSSRRDAWTSYSDLPGFARERFHLDRKNKSKPLTP